MGDYIVTTKTIRGVYHVYYSRDGVIMAEYRASKEDGCNVGRWYHKDKLHFDGGPAVLKYKNGQKVEECWYRHGEKHRDDGPAVTQHAKGNVTIKFWFCQDKRHREDGPTEIHYKNDQITKECWYRHGIQHREDGPAEIYYKKGKKVREFWHSNSKWHREDGPAVIQYEKGKIAAERWCRDGKLCPIGVLASVTYRDISLEKFHWIDGDPTNIDEFRDAVKGDAIHDALRPLPIPIRQAIIPHYCYQ